MTSDKQSNKGKTDAENNIPTGEAGIRRERERFQSDEYRPPAWADELRGSNADFTPMVIETTDDSLDLSDAEEYRCCDE